MSKTNSKKNAGKIMGNFLLFGMEQPFFDAFVEAGAIPKIWVKTGREPGEKTVGETVIFDHSPLKFTEIDAVFAKEMPPQLADQVRSEAMPYYVRNINRSERSLKDRSKSWVDYHNRLEMMIHFYYRQLTKHKIDTVIFDNMPHGGSTIALYFMAKAMKLHTAFCYQSNFQNRFFILDDFRDFGYFTNAHKGAEDPSIYVNDNPVAPFYMSGRDSRLTIIRDYIWTWCELVYNHFTRLTGGKDKRRPKSRHMHILKERYAMLKVQSHYPKNITLPKNFIYFPLQFQPELTADVLGSKYADQLLLLEELRRIVPDTMEILVKENPKQTLYAREPSFFQRLEVMPNVTYVNGLVDSFNLIKNCQGVATSVGTAGWEALQLGKPVICFGHTWYRGLPGVFNWEDEPSWDQIKKFGFDRKKLERAVKKISRYFHQGISQPKGFSAVTPGFDPRTNADSVTGHVIDYVRHLKK